MDDQPKPKRKYFYLQFRLGGDSDDSARAKAIREWKKEGIFPERVREMVDWARGEPRPATETELEQRLANVENQLQEQRTLLLEIRQSLQELQEKGVMVSQEQDGNLPSSQTGSQARSVLEVVGNINLSQFGI